MYQTDGSHPVRVPVDLACLRCMRKFPLLSMRENQGGTIELRVPINTKLGDWFSIYRSILLFTQRSFWFIFPCRRFLDTF